MHRPPMIRWLFEDRTTGRLVIGQKPNLLMLVFLAAFGARWLLRPRGPKDQALRLVEGGSIALWSLDELIRGVNPFRRIGGALVLLALAARRGP